MKLCLMEFVIIIKAGGIMESELMNIHEMYSGLWVVLLICGCNTSSRVGRTLDKRLP